MDREDMIILCSRCIDYLKSSGSCGGVYVGEEIDEEECATLGRKHVCEWCGEDDDESEWDGETLYDCHF